MTEYSNENSGAMFKNETDNEKAPAYKGKVNVEGTDYQIAAWIRTSKAGQKFMSLKVQPMNANGSAKPVAKSSGFADLDDSIPF
jgi:uncharacterized protein (DUF736 family)